jgi:hypothetical protein
VAVDYVWCQLSELGEMVGKWRGSREIPSRTRKPMSFQSIVLTHGGGNAILGRVGEREVQYLSELWL